MSTDDAPDDTQPSAEARAPRDEGPPARPGPVECRHLVQLLGDYVDDTLAKDARAAVDAHIGQCAPCLAFLKQYRFGSDAVRRVLLDRVPSDLENRLLSFLRRRTKQDEVG